MNWGRNSKAQASHGQRSQPDQTIRANVVKVSSKVSHHSTVQQHEKNAPKYCHAELLRSKTLWPRLGNMFFGGGAVHTWTSEINVKRIDWNPSLVQSTVHMLAAPAAITVTQWAPGKISAPWDDNHAISGRSRPQKPKLARHDHNSWGLEVLNRFRCLTIKFDISKYLLAPIYRR